MRLFPFRMATVTWLKIPHLPSVFVGIFRKTCQSKFLVTQLLLLKAAENTETSGIQHRTVPTYKRKLSRSREAMRHLLLYMQKNCRHRKQLEKAQAINIYKTGDQFNVLIRLEHHGSAINVGEQI